MKNPKKVDFFHKVADPKTNTVHNAVIELLTAFDGDAYKARVAVSFAATLTVADSKYIENSDMSTKRKAVLMGAKFADIKYMHEISQALKAHEIGLVNLLEDKQDDGNNEYEDLV